MSLKINSYENDKMESFFRTLKVEEEMYIGDCQIFEDILEAVPYFIEEVYNRQRLHSSLGYVSPEEFEYRFNKKNFYQLVLN